MDFLGCMGYRPYLPGGVGAGGGEQQDGGDGDHRRGSRPDDPLQVCPRPPQQDEHTSTRENSYGIGKQTFFISSTFRLKISIKKFGRTLCIA